VKILLLNDNPVVNKLVTLSAQKTSDELEAVENIEDIENDSYDLFVLDDTKYTQDVMNELANKITFSKSLYICSKNAEEVSGFTSTLRKPFLPTDLVDLFALLAREASTIDLDTPPVSDEVLELDDIDTEELGEIDELDDLDDIEADGEIGGIEDLDTDEDELQLEDIDEIDIDDISEKIQSSQGDEDLELYKEDIGEGDEVEGLKEMEEELELPDDLDLEEVDEIEALTLDEEEPELEALEDTDLELPDDLELDENLTPETDEDLEDGILDKDDLQEVQDLLEMDEEENEKEPELEGLEDTDLELPDDLELDEEDIGEPAQADEIEDLEETELELPDDLELEEEPELEGLEDTDLELPDDLELDEEDIGEPAQADEIEDLEETELELPDDLEIDESVEDLETQIQTAVANLSDEELESEVDEAMLLDIANIDSLTSRDLKLAIGEEVTQESTTESSQGSEVSGIEDSSLESISESDEETKIPTNTEITTDNDGVESLKKLLTALSNEDVAASLKGMKININISLGDN